MKRIARTVVLFLFIILSHTAYSQQLDRMYVSDTLSSGRLAGMYYSMAVDETDSLESSKLFSMALGKYREAFASGVLSRADSVDVLLNMAICHVNTGGDPEEITAVLQQALDVKGRDGTETLGYADAVRCVARVCDIAGDHAQAHVLLDRCEAMIRNLCGDKYEGYAAKVYSLYLFARSLNELNNGRIANSYRCSCRADRLMVDEGITGEVYSANLRVLSDLAGVMMQPRRMRKYLHRASETYKADLMGRFEKMSEMRRNMYWEDASSYFDGILSAVYATDPAEMRADAYDALLFSKGLLLNTSVAYREFIENSGSVQAHRSLKVMDSLVSEGADPRLIDSVDLSIVRMLESQGLRMPKVRDVRWEDVRDALGKDDLAIEFFRLADGNYGAMLLKRGWKAPKVVKLGKSYKTGRRQWRSFEAPFTARDMLGASDSLRSDDCLKSSAIWCRKIVRYFPVTSQGRIFFAPDGVFHQTGIEYLPLFTGPGYDGSTVMDHFKIYRISSTRELVSDGTPETAEESASIYGGMMFNPPQADLDYAVSLLPDVDSSLVDVFYEEELNAMPEVSSDGHARDGSYIHPLPKTLKEVHEVDDVVSEYGSESRLYTGVFANEEAFKQKTYGQDIIHVATHGFYVSASDAIGGGHLYYKVRFSHNPAVLSDPMYRSGLHFSGAAPAWAGFPDVPGLEDGVLTAKEVSLLNLSHAELVVLSACQTGAGEISKDGVYGLQRAFKKAGAKSIIMSLWEVDDNATYLMMSRFYHNRFILRMSRYEAFAAAQRQLRAAYPDPYYWRAFILLDPEI